MNDRSRKNDRLALEALSESACEVRFDGEDLMQQGGTMTGRLTESRIGEIWNGMPGGLQRFMVDWGYMNFARAIEGAVRGTDSERDADDRDALIAELEWALANNADRPRTEFALRLALEAIEAMEEREVRA